MEFLYLLEKVRIACPPLAAVFSVITYLGDEIAFLAAALFVLWCVSKQGGIYLLTVGFVGTLINQFLKIVCRIPRPWVLDPEFTIWEGARDAATGYSFPSGHTQNAIGTFGAIALLCRGRLTGRAYRILAGCMIAIAVAVPFSRMLLGVHTPKDVLVSAAIAVSLVFLCHLFFRRERSIGELSVAVGAMAILALGFVLFVELFPFPDSTDPANLLSARENAWTLLGAVLGVLAMVQIEERWIRYETKATLLGQILKLTLGAALTVGIKSLLKLPLHAIFGDLPFTDGIRYFLVVLFCGCVWPLTFPYFAKLGAKKTEKES